MNYLKNYKGTVLVISHDRFFLDTVTNNTFEVINGHVNCYNVPYTKFFEQRKKNYENQLKAYNLQQAEIKRQKWLEKKPNESWMYYFKRTGQNPYDYLINGFYYGY